ncbi:hypothetical protein LX32DRAFT_405413 [Colletotrichum zoysiae]|uniref:Transmembrane protein n=1 Tax=Colletotrichum zoysiae TaxID=1216348 RepID=A0AAD9M0P9_9PEZI|nr:hypothetical protein LX32DRAFT_405413 [Colletotrichum zoysiae]
MHVNLGGLGTERREAKMWKVARMSGCGVASSPTRFFFCLPFCFSRFFLFSFLFCGSLFPCICILALGYFLVLSQCAPSTPQSIFPNGFTKKEREK